MTELRDTIRVNELRLVVPIGNDQGSASLQPIRVTVSLAHDIEPAARTDDLSLTVDYGRLKSALVSAFAATPQFFESLDALLAFTSQNAHREIERQLGHACHALNVHIFQDMPPPVCKTVSAELSWLKTAQEPLERVTYTLQDLDCQVLVGVNPIERKFKQLVRFNIRIERASSPLEMSEWLDIPLLINTLVKALEKTTYLTLEALCSFAAAETLRSLIPEPARSVTAASRVHVIASKPVAMSSVLSADVEISRTFTDYPDLFSVDSSNCWMPNDHETYRQNQAKGIHTAALALGSNLGDSFHNIEHALRLLETPAHVLNDGSLQVADARVDVIDTSFMYKTKPMYVEEQPPFINCACIIETNLQPVPLLRLLKAIENLVGRVPSIRNGPRAVDLDIILYDDAVIDTRPQDQRTDLNNLEGQLVVPHPRLQEREFVLRPLFDMIPDYVHPKLRKTIRSLLEAMPEIDPSMQAVVPFPQASENAIAALKAHNLQPLPTLTHWTHFQNTSPTSRQTRLPRKTHVMATLNVTPDSFSDGSAHTKLEAALHYVRNAVASGASIVDIGGYSTRPHAAFVSVEEEIQRVVPVIKAIRKDEDPAVRNILISVDTFRPEVAEGAIYAGANCVNDVHAFTGPDSYPSYEGRDARSCMVNMKKLARETAVPVILMHSRGDAGQNKDYGEYAYAQDLATGGPGIEGVRVELGRKVDEIVKGKGGVRRWLVVVDPGIGFSKTLEVNLEVLRDSSLLTADLWVGTGGRRRNPLRGYPTLIGASKKSFLGVILNQGEASRETAASERNWATAATVACAVQQGALITRVHDTREMHDVVKVAQAIWS